MTREEIIDSIWGDAVLRNINIVRDDVVEMVDFVLKNHCIESPGLDEAAEDVYKEHLRESEDIEFLDKNLSIGMFKSGAEWMAGQGYIREGVARPDDCEIWVNMIDTDIKDGDKVIVQIRKK